MESEVAREEDFSALDAERRALTRSAAHLSALEADVGELERQLAEEKEEAAARRKKFDVGVRQAELHRRHTSALDKAAAAEESVSV